VGARSPLGHSKRPLAAGLFQISKRFLHHQNEVPSMPQDTTVADTILAQLGGKHFSERTGAYSFSAAPTYLSFRMPSNTSRHQIGGVKIHLTPADLYKIEFIALREVDGLLSAVVIETCDDIYFDSLNDVIQRVTGLPARKNSVSTPSN
jgi:hypothetical protein